MKLEEKKTPLLACLVRGKKMWRFWLGEGDVRSADGYEREKKVMAERERRDRWIRKIGLVFDSVREERWPQGGGDSALALEYIRWNDSKR